MSLQISTYPTSIFIDGQHVSMCRTFTYLSRLCRLRYCYAAHIDFPVHDGCTESNFYLLSQSSAMVFVDYCLQIFDKLNRIVSN